MKTITAVLRARPGTEATMRDALLKMADHVRANEPETIGYHISQDASDPCVFTTYERFADQAAMDRHGDSPALAEFFKTTNPILDGEVIIHTGDEISAK